MSERVKFISRLLEGESMATLCREFGISRKTGYKFKKRFEELGIDGFRDFNRRPRGHPYKTPQNKIDTIVAMRERYGWGPIKLKRRLEDLYPQKNWPAHSTIGVILKHEGFIRERRKKRKAKPSELPLANSSTANEIWSIDFKGHFKTLDRKYCYPLTVCDHFSRYLLCCEALSNTRTPGVKEALAELFLSRGLPLRMRSDNGAPFASTNNLGLTRLAVWLLRQGIELERIQPGHPEQNGRHERMHKTLKAETTKPPEKNLLRQQERFTAFQECFNKERPHQAIGLDTPEKHYKPSSRAYLLPEIPLSYPTAQTVCKVQKEGNIFLRPIGESFFIGSAFEGENLGLSELTSSTWAVTFLETQIGYLDTATRQFLVDLPPQWRSEAHHRGKSNV